MRDDTRKSVFAARLEWIALTVNVSASFLLLGWVMFRCRSGFDFTDEGFYLNWISNPQNFRASVTQFGFVYHPLYKLIGGNIALLRQVNSFDHLHFILHIVHRVVPLSLQGLDSASLISAPGLYWCSGRPRIVFTGILRSLDTFSELQFSRASVADRDCDRHAIGRSQIIDGKYRGMDLDRNRRWMFFFSKADDRSYARLLGLWLCYCGGEI